MIRINPYKGKYSLYIDGTNAGQQPPSFTINPTISGTAVVGQTLSVSFTLNNADTVTRKWYRNGVLVFTSTTSNDYVPVQADAGNTSNIKCNVEGSNGAGSVNADSNTIAQILTVRTNAFLATGIADAALTAALNTFDIGLIANSITNLRGFYPMYGNSASACKWNFLDPRDLDAAFRLVFSGTWGYTSTGAAPNGVNASANTFFNPSVDASSNGFGFGIYSRTNSTTGTQIYGVISTGTNTPLTQHNLSAANFVNGTLSQNLISYTANPSTRFLYCRRSSTTMMQAYRDGVSLGTNTTAPSSMPNGQFRFGGRFNAGAAVVDFFSSHEIACAVLDVGLTDAQALTLRTLVDQFVTTLGRNV